jgi:hypothetical protein
MDELFPIARDADAVDRPGIPDGSRLFAPAIELNHLSDVCATGRIENQCSVIRHRDERAADGCGYAPRDWPLNRSNA